jgi:hypothetical protein
MTAQLVREPEEAVRLVDEACRGPALGVWDVLEPELDAGVLGSLRRAIDAHDALLQECGLLREGPEASDQRAALVAYRHGVLNDVLAQLEEGLGRGGPVGRVVAALDDAWQEAVRLSSELPRLATVRWGAGALDVMPSDGPARRIGKAWGRVFGAARKADRARPAPLRALALEHLQRHVGPALQVGAVASAQAWAAWVLRLEDACAEWADEVLPALAVADTAKVAERGTKPVGGGAGEGVGADEESTSVVEPSGGADDPGGSVTEDDAALGDPMRHAREAAKAFGSTLAELAAATPHAEARSAMEARLAQAAEALSSDVRVAGSFVHRPSPVSSRDLDLRRLTRARRVLASWDEQAAARISLHRAYLSVLVGGAAVREKLVDRARVALLDPVRALEGDVVSLARLAEDVRRTGSVEARGDSFTALRASTEEVVRAAAARVADAAVSAESLDGMLGDTIDALHGIVGQAPAVLVLHRRESSTPDKLRVSEERAVPFQELARQSLDALRVERIRSAMLGLERAVAPAQVEVGELPSVISFAFDAAAKELQADSVARGEASPAEGAGASERATRLFLEALDRSADVLRQAPLTVESALVAADARVAEELSGGALLLLDRIGAGRMHAQLLRARSRFSALRVRIADRLRPRLRRVRRLLRLLWLRTRRAGHRWIRRARAAIGDQPVRGARGERTVRAFARADSGPGHVPLVYQRLFSLDPVEDASFLVGRGGELAEMLKRWRRWREEDEVPVVVRGNPGTGVTSLLRVTAGMFEAEGASVRHMEITERILDEATLVSRLKDAVGEGPESTLEELAARILRSERGGVPDVVVVDGLEHLYLRVPGGTDLLERFLTLMSETEPRIFWIAGMGQSAWKLVVKAEPVAIAQVDGVEIGALPVDRLRETVLQRHRRSGLRLRFEEPREGRTLLRRRLRGLRGTEGHRRLLEEDFFEQLHRVALGNLRLALFHWLLAADFDTEEGGVLMRPPVRPEFGVLEGLEMTQNFTLKALLEHGTLTLAEHDAVFRVTHQASYQIFESLQNRMLIEELDPRPAWEQEDSEIRRASRYRIRPLLVGAVGAHLRKLNVVH